MTGEPPRSTSGGGLADLGVEERLEGREGVDRRAVDAQEDVAELEGAVGRAAGEDLLDDEEARRGRERGAHRLLGRRPQAEAAQLVVGAEAEGRRQRAAGHRLAALQELEGADDPRQRQEEARGRLVAAAGVEGDDVAVDVEDGRARRAAGGARRRLDVAGVEVVVAAQAVVRRRAVEAGDGAGEDRQLLAGVVADDADLGADLRLLRGEAQRLGGHEAQGRGVEAEEAEVVDRVAVDRLQRRLLVVEEDRLSHGGARADDVAVGQQEAALRVDDEGGRLR
ncbi:MAG: hypothetical protein R3A79_00480 [Nannocystaceae bacterium]